MVDTTSNDNELTVKPTRDRDANGQAALLLVESLIHGLIEGSILATEDAADIVSSATDIARLLDEDPGPYRAAHALLGAIGNSLSHDIPENA